MNTPSALAMPAAQRSALADARSRLNAARPNARQRPLHDRPQPLALHPRTLMELALMVLLPTGLLIAFKPVLLAFWHSVMVGWSTLLDLPLALVRTGAADTLQWAPGYQGALVPETTTGLLVAAGVVLAAMATRFMSDRQTPLRQLVLGLCVVQAAALLFFWLSPTSFAYTLSSHLAALLNAGYYLMLVLPLLLALGWGVLQVPLHQKLLVPPLVLAYFALMLPHKALLHALVVQQFSVLFMPLLYLVFGAMLDLLVFMALYAWLVSTAPPLPAAMTRSAR